MRALFFLVSGLLDRRIGVKLVLHYGHLQDDSIPEIATGPSLTVIVVILAVTTVASLIKTRRDPSARAHAGSLRDRPAEGKPDSVLVE